MIESKSYLVESIYHEAPRPKETDGRTKRLIKAMQQHGGELTYVGHLALLLPDGRIIHDDSSEVITTDEQTEIAA